MDIRQIFWYWHVLLKTFENSKVLFSRFKEVFSFSFLKILSSKRCKCVTLQYLFLLVMSRKMHTCYDIRKRFSSGKTHSMLWHVFIIIKLFVIRYIFRYILVVECKYFIFEIESISLFKYWVCAEKHPFLSKELRGGRNTKRRPPNVNGWWQM